MGSDTRNSGLHRTRHTCSALQWPLGKEQDWTEECGGGAPRRVFFLLSHGNTLQRREGRSDSWVSVFGSGSWNHKWKEL